MNNTTRQVMVDLETLSVRPYATILSIGAVAFNIEQGVLDTFYTNVDANSCKDAGLHISKDTVEWWSQQSKEARKALTVNPLPVTQALENFAEWFGNDRQTIIWGNGAAFDISILESAYWNTELTIPWSPWKVQCYRTVLNLVGINNSQIRKSESDGTHHNALDDAMSQTKTLLKILRT